MLHHKERGERNARVGVIGEQDHEGTLNRQLTLLSYHASCAISCTLMQNRGSSRSRLTPYSGTGTVTLRKLFARPAARPPDKVRSVLAVVVDINFSCEGWR